MKNMMRGVVWVVMGLWAGPAWAQSVVITPSPIPAVSAGCVLQVQSISPTVWICGSAGSGSVTSTGTLTADTLTAWSSSGVLKNSVVTQSGTVVSAPTFNATTAITLNGTNINTTGALGNVVYVSTAPVLTGTNFTGIPAAAVTGTAVTLSGTQTITGVKTFAADIMIGTTTGGNITWSANAAQNSRAYLVTAETNTGTGAVYMQAGQGSAGFGGGLSLYGHANATYPGWVIAGISAGSGGYFAVNAHGLGTGTNTFKVEGSTGNTTTIGTVVVGGAYTSVDKISIGGGASGSYGLSIGNYGEGGATKAYLRYDRDNLYSVLGAVGTPGGTATTFALRTNVNGTEQNTMTINYAGTISMNLGAANDLKFSNSGGYNFITFNNSLSLFTGLGIAAGAAGDASNIYINVPTGGYQYFTVNGSSIASFSPTGVFSVGGFGIHTFSAGGTGFNVLRLRNTTAGTGNGSELQLGNDLATDRGFFDVYSSTYTTSAIGLADGLAIGMQGTGGLSIAATNASGAIRFYAGGSTERMRIDSGGSLVIGTTGSGVTTSPGFKFNPSATQPQFAIVSNDATSGQTPITVYNTNATNNGYRFYVKLDGGVANFSGNNINLSDARVKTDIKPLASMWDKFKALDIVTFKYRNQGRDDFHIGVIAQQVESVAPEFVNVYGFGETPADGVPLKSIYTTDLYHATIKALQEAMTRIEALEAQVTALSHPVKRQ